MRKIWVPALGLALLIVVPSPAQSQLQKVARSPAPGTMWLHAERIPLVDGGFATAERGYYFAPVNRNDPKSEVIGVEVYRFRRDASADAKTPPIFRLHGGPTFAGFERSLASRGYYEREVRPYLAITDFVVIGQRGIGSSRPNTVCERPRTVRYDDQAARVAAQHEAARRCQEFWRQWGVDLEGLTVMQAAADVDDVRKAFGYDRIQIRGGSFGSHWGMAVMRFYPQTVTRAVLRGLEGPDHTWDRPSGVMNAVARMAAAADTATALRGQIPAGGLFKALRDVIAKLNREPALVVVRDSAKGTADTVRVDGNAVAEIAVTAPRNLPALILALHRGDYTVPARARLNDGQSGYLTASYFMLDCGSGITPERARAYRADSAVGVIGDRNWSYWVNCPVWPSDNGAAFRDYFQTDIPTVFIQGDWDVSTPMENSLELKPHFRNLHYILVKGGSHGAQTEARAASDLFQRELLEFYATGDMTGLPTEVALPPVRWAVPAR